MNRYYFSLKDIHSNFFHFTQRKNLNAISIDGLLPKVGNHAKYLEKTEKVFFTEGLDNLLILFDCWINACKRLPLLPFVYNIGSRFLRYRWFPNFIADGYFQLVSHSKMHITRGYKMFDKLLYDCVLLQLNIQEGIDYKKNDIDEIKMRGYQKKHLITMGYSETYSDVNSPLMDKWNMHILSNHKIIPVNIKICEINCTDKMKDILIYALNHTKLDLKNICPVLCDYLYSRNIEIRK